MKQRGLRGGLGAHVTPFIRIIADSCPTAGANRILRSFITGCAALVAIYHNTTECLRLEAPYWCHSGIVDTYLNGKARAKVYSQRQDTFKETLGCLLNH